MIESISRENAPKSESVANARLRQTAHHIRERIRESRRLNKSLRDEAREAIIEARVIRQEMQDILALNHCFPSKISFDSSDRSCNSSFVSEISEND